jgi:heparosan-N-sulfate-glucuronate 5-epimerase
MVNGVVARLRLLRAWSAILFGRSYGHRPQDIGAFFVPDRLHGYFVDLTAKTEYDGERDPQGLPLIRARGRLIHHPTVVLQLGLGHWDRSLAADPRADDHRRRFLDVATWTDASLDDRGGLPVFPQLGFDTATPYSAMTQGLAMSVLARASLLGGPVDWLDRARQVARLMLEPIDSGGTSRLIPAGIVLEEGPLVPPNTIMNGWLFGLFGLHDLMLADRPGDPMLATALQETLAAFIAGLPTFDAGWWSRYDSAGHLASPFYHRLHVAQLTALEQAFPAESAPVRAVRSRWQRTLRSPLQRTRAIIRKVMQQMAEPPPRIR